MQYACKERGGKQEQLLLNKQTNIFCKAEMKKEPKTLTWEQLPPPPVGLLCKAKAPSEDECLAIWNSVGMPDHIRMHSELVAAYALFLGKQLVSRGVKLDLPGLYAAGLLHDIAKYFCLQNGGSHAQVGAAWVVQLTAEPLLAQGVLHHVYWPWQICFNSWPLPLLIQYADKRVMHNSFVDLETRFDDLVKRYGHSERSLYFLGKAREQADCMEEQLLTKYKVDINASFTHSWRLVQ